MVRRSLLSAFLLLSPAAAPAFAAGVVLVEDGRPRCAIHVAADVAAADKPTNGLKYPELEKETQRRRLRESAHDLALYLEKMSGARVPVLAGPPEKDDDRLPVLVGDLAAAAFGPPKQAGPFKQGFRLVVSSKGVGLLGASDLASSYAVYELLDRLGCRWFLPGELGEVVPERKTIALDEVDFSSAPATAYRGVWYADDAYRRRNRMGGVNLSAGHALEFYFSKEDREKHPEWRAEIGGKPHPERLRWSSESLAEALADKIDARYEADPQPTYSLSPDDGMNFDESKDDKALDAGDFDPSMGVPSITDRLMVLCNRVATRVNAKHPDVRFGLLAYVNYFRPPVREKVNPSIVPQIAPINFSRRHPMTDDAVPHNKELRQVIEGWGKAATETSIYFYAYNLAETSAPIPMIRKWSDDVPFVLKNNCKYFQPETLPNFETTMHALYLGNRLAFDPTLKPQDVIDDLNTRFYGHAAKEMAAYWKYVDDAWVDALGYSGCCFGYLRVWAPERLAKARELMDAGLAACRTPMETRRVKLADDSLRLFEAFMKMRRDLAEGRFTDLPAQAKAWRERVLELGEKYKDNYCFTRVPWTPLTVDGLYFSSFCEPAYDDIGRIARDYEILTPRPITQFLYAADPDRTGESSGNAKPDFNDQSWRTTDVCRDTWSSLGYHDYMKSMWYRTDVDVDVPATPAGRHVYLWVGATDGSAKLFVNGKHVPWVNEKGEVKEQFEGYCQPASWDVTSAIKPGAGNTIAILCTRTFLNELGTGGLLAPVVIYRDRERQWLRATAYAIPKETATEGEGYFSIIEGHNQRLYIGTHSNGRDAWLVEFDEASKRMMPVADAMKEIGSDAKGFAAQAKIHTRNNVGASGKIYFGTKQGYPAKDEKGDEYPGGYPMVYDPETGKTKVYPIPVPHQGIVSVTPDESRGVAYVSTCSDGRPGPGESAHFLVLDLKTGKYRDLIDTHHIYAFIVVDHLGRAYHPLLGGDVARYDPKTDKLERLKQTIDGQPPTADSRLADPDGMQPINWDISPDGKTLYSVPMSGNHLYRYDLTADGDVLPGKDLGPLLPSGKGTDCRALCVGPTGTAWAAITEAADGIQLAHLVSYTPGDEAPRDRGPVAIRNPDYTEFADKDGKPLPFHGGQTKLPDGATTTKYVILGVCEGRDGSVYTLALQPYTLLQVPAEQLK